MKSVSKRHMRRLFKKERILYSNKLLLCNVAQSEDSNPSVGVSCTNEVDIQMDDIINIPDEQCVDRKSLNEINRSISEENREAYINTMKSLLKGRLPKTLTEIISINLCMDINLDGIHGKRRLKDFEVFFHTLTDACRTLGSQDVEKDIRNALKIIKKCAIHAQCIKNKKQLKN
ncbi:uncharacterized protein LOC119610958 [Lucilia sericata]|uniref:uncharacterized protein LOC119610958 n=1 Tax=Lucilia sericata TaxID=13632 RepID=UPI0018A8477E|nr:uncharacterized protein LOC119610958 [Lucilia sericata]